MSKKQWLVLLMLFLTYLLLGASIFHHIESRLEAEKAHRARQERIEINALLHAHYMPDTTHDQHEILEKLTEYCGKSVYNYTEGEKDPLKWDFYNSFYFAYTVVSTIGYGNLAPTNMLDRILMIFYGVVGIPMNGILLTQLGEFFSQVFVKAHKKYKSYKQGQSDSSHKLMTPLETRKVGLAAQIFMYLIPGFVMFIFFPAFLFSHYEGWSYDEAVYYAFVTLTTIGFGDYVAGQDNTKGSGVFFILYKIFLICWISFGLGYIVMIMTFIARGMRSKKITRIEHKLAHNLKLTQSKIWNEFNKEVNYLRRVFNELQLSKVKRVYVDEYDYDTPPAKFPRSNSFPDLRDLMYGGLETPLPPHPRRRANSEVVPTETQVPRVVSETDLQRIDKNATFASHAMVQPAELLARLVNVLGYVPPPEEDDEDEREEEQQKGVQGFADKDILASERSWNGSIWRLGGEKLPSSRLRSRATSEVRLGPKYDQQANHQNAEWTWSGPAASRKIQEFMKARGAEETPTSKEGKARSRFASFALPSVPKMVLPRWIRQLSHKKSVDEPSRTDSMSADDVEGRIRDSYPSHTPTNDQFPSTRATERRSSNSPNYHTYTGASNLPGSMEGSNLLEETSLADFLRALTALHTRVGAVPDEFARKPQRKMGTASLTPPQLPSLFTLFSPQSGATSANQSQQNTFTAAAAAAAAAQNAARRFSLRTAENSGSSTPSYRRRGSLALAVRPRRYSLRPDLTPPRNGSPHLELNQRRFPDRQNPPPYSSDPFILECPKEPLVSKEGVSQGVSSPVTASVARRFSLRPAQIGVPPEPASPKLRPTPTAAVPATKAVPRWKAGLLQRHISEMNLQRRSRAFSLSDVNTERVERLHPGLSPLALQGSGKESPTRKITSPAGCKETKIVTIVSPTLSRATDSKQGAIGPAEYSGVLGSPMFERNPDALTLQPQHPKQQSLLKTAVQHSIQSRVPATTNPFVVSCTNPFVSDAVQEHHPVTQSKASSNIFSTVNDDKVAVDVSVSRPAHQTTEKTESSTQRGEASREGALKAVVVDKMREDIGEKVFQIIEKTNSVTQPAAGERAGSESDHVASMLRSTVFTVVDEKLPAKVEAIGKSREDPPQDFERLATKTAPIIFQRTAASPGRLATASDDHTDEEIQRSESKSVDGKVPTISRSGSASSDESTSGYVEKLVKKESASDSKSTGRKISTMSQLSAGRSAQEDSEKQTASRKVSAVSLSAWTDNQRPISDRKISTNSQQGVSVECASPPRKTSTASAGSPGTVQGSVGSRKVSTVSQQSCSATGSTASSRKSSSVKSPGDKPQVSIDPYKSPMEVTIEKAAVNPFEQYKATFEKISVDNGKHREGSSTEHKRRVSSGSKSVTQPHEAQNREGR